MKVFKLIVHQKNFSEEELIINPKDIPNLQPNDVVEIYHAEDEFSRLLLQVPSLRVREELQQKDTISIEQSIAAAFQLRTYTDVNVSIVNPQSVALDSVELTFKDQYMGRSEMWRLKNNLVNTCVYINKKVEFCSGTIRCQVHEMWAGGERVACGVITDGTKVVFRSSTSMVYLFLQMSSEMWEFDIHGDLYFEKALNGFLSELFSKWKKNGSNHEVTIVLFSRTFYKAHCLDEFPEHMRECLQQDYKGRFYEDFYRVAVQNERYEDWTNTLTELRRLFVDYQKSVLEYHKRPGFTIPKAYNSTAAQGNFLEVLNMSLNVFEKHFLDRSFDRTGQLSVVITPGVGVFEVDRELTNITKQRIIDNGVGSDLVCVGEQPLHAVPLLKFHNKDTSLNVGDDYSMPHWINLSFYSTNKKVGYSTFAPRIKLPSKKTRNSCSKEGIAHVSKFIQEETSLPNSMYDYDAYDAEVFNLPTSHNARCSLSLHRSSGRKKVTSSDSQCSSQKLLRRKMSDPDIRHSSVDSSESMMHMLSPKTASLAIPTAPYKEITQYSSSFGLPNADKAKPKPFCSEWDGETVSTQQCMGDSVPYEHNPVKRYLLRPGRALINPFDPSHVTIKLTSNRRRWTHIFPKGPTGVLIQQHHYQAVPMKTSEDCPQDLNSVFGSPVPVESEIRQQSKSVSHGSFHDVYGTSSRSRYYSDGGHADRSLTLLWGATGEQEWTPALTTGYWNDQDRDFFVLELQELSDTAVGVDWKSLTIPACLPITTDYFPEGSSLENDYFISDYNILPDDVNAEYAQQRAVYRKPLTTQEVFKELVSQRLAQGFQLIVLQPPNPPPSADVMSNFSPPFQPSVSATAWSPPPAKVENSEEFLLSIGRMFHKIELISGSEIRVIRYRPRHPYPVKNIHYRYRFQAPDHHSYEVSWIEFTTEKLENYNWSYLDHYICTRGDRDFALQESFKYWRFRMYLLPVYQPATKRILDGTDRCDIYTPMSTEEHYSLVDGFLRFMENCINKIRRPTVGKKPRGRRESGQFVPNPAAIKNHGRRYSLVIPSSTQSNYTSAGTTSSHGQFNFQQLSSTGSAVFRERLGSNRVNDYHRPRSGSKIMERVKSEATGSGRASPAVENAISPVVGSLDSTIEGEAAEENGVNAEVKLLKSSASHAEILEAMKNPTSGLSYLSQLQFLPNWTFVSADATQWLMENMEGINSEQEGLGVFQELLKEKLLCHASGKSEHPFIHGFYLYYIVQSEKEITKDSDGSLVHGNLISFQNEWIETEIQYYRNLKLASSPHSQVAPCSFPLDFLLPDISHLTKAGHTAPRYQPTRYKDAYLDIDVSNKSDREEWGHAKYQAAYNPEEPFELVIQWMNATGAVVTDLLNSWARKAQPCNFQLVPIPCDSFALPCSYKSDPLRGPVFVPLDTDCLLDGKTTLFEEFPEESHVYRLFLFRELIVRRFGFVRCPADQAQQSNPRTVTQHHYVHLTGNMFIMIAASLPLSPQPEGIAISRRLASEHPVPSPHENYITRHVSGKTKSCDDAVEDRIGFLWSWNYMVSKRWRYSPSLGLGDENFQNKMLKDFQEFCCNDNNRLREFWQTCWDQMEA